MPEVNYGDGNSYVAVNYEKRTIEIQQCPCFLKANYYLKIQNAHFNFLVLEIQLQI